MDVTKFKASNALSINRKIIPKAKDEDKNKLDKKMFKENEIAKNSDIRKKKRSKIFA